MVSFPSPFRPTLRSLSSVFRQLDISFEFFQPTIYYCVKLIKMYVFLFSFLCSAGNNASELLRQIGSVLIHDCTDERLIRAFRSLGGTFHDFLTTLDGVHDVIQGQAENATSDQVRRLSPRTRNDFVKSPARLHRVNHSKCVPLNAE